MSVNTIIVNGIPVNIESDVLIRLLASAGGTVPSNAPLMKDYAMTWFEHYKKPTLKTKTIICYRTMFNHILPFFGEMQLTEITTSDIQSFFDQFRDASRSTVKHMKDVLHQIFDSAIEDGYITKNPTDSKRLVMPSKVTERQPLKPEQVRHILQEMPRLDLQARLLLMLLLYTGERKGEVRGLRWEDIDFENNLIHVRRAISSAQNQPTVVSTKSKAGIRDIPLLPELRRFLQQFKQREGYLLGRQRPLTEAQYRRLFDRIGLKVNLYGATSHVFRHTFLTMAASSLDPKTLQAIAGHASCDITMNRYVHKRDDKVKESRQKLAGLFD